MYLRKALYIRDKDKNSLLSNSTTESQKLASKSIDASRLFNDSMLNLNENSSKRLEDQSDDELEQKLSTNEEQNTIAEILFDLGCLLFTFESNISKREAFDCLRRSLDIKILLLGAEHMDCKIIKKKLNEINSYLSMYSYSLSRGFNMENSREQLSRTSSFGNRSTSSIKIYAQVSPRKKLEKYLQNFRKQNDLGSESNTVSGELNEWIKKNSIIEVIPSRSKFSNRNDSGSILLSSERSNEFLQTSMYADQSETYSSQPNTSLVSGIDTANVQLLQLKNKQNRANNTNQVKTGYTRSLSLNSRSQSKADNSVHLRNCKCPTAVSIDVHNVKSVNGPHSDIRTLLSVKRGNSLRREDDLAEMQKNVKSKVSKHVYYKSSWYDVPPGSSKNRFKKFIKLAPNA